MTPPANPSSPGADRSADRPFGLRLVEMVASTGPLCAGIDPSAALLGRWGLSDDAGGLRRFASACVDAFAGVVPVVKPQVAFFERHGAAGYAVLEELLGRCRDEGLLTIADAKRGDIDSTAAAYGDAWLGEASPLAADAVTVHPYLGLGALAPVVGTARRTGRGVFVVARSSNPEGRALQEAVTASGRSVEDDVLRQAAELNRAAGERPGPVGAVVGATMGPPSFPLGELGGVVLAPGVGAQGATPAEVAARFSGCPPHTVVANVSRALLSAGPDVASLRDAARRWLDATAAAWG